MTLRPLPVVLSALLLAAALPAQTSKPPAVVVAASPDAANPTAQLTRMAMPGGVALSPDGTTVAWTLGQRGNTTLHLTSVADPDPGKEKLITPNGATSCSNTSPIWSPDGATLAFTSTCTSKQEKPGQEQIFLWSKATGEVKQLTHVVGNIAQPAWSPDGKAIAFLFVENATRSAGALDAMKPWAGVIGEDGVEIQRVYGVDVATGLGDWLSPDPKLHVYEFAWAPDSQHVAYIAAPPPGENNWWVAKLYTQTLGGFAHCGLVGTATVCKSSDAPMGVPAVVLDPSTVSGPLHGLQIAVPRYSPDGKRIAIIGGLMSDQGSTGGDVWVVNADGKGEPVDITPGIDGTPCFEAWLNDKEIGFVEDRRGHTLLVDYDAVGHSEIARNDLGEVSVSGGPIKDAFSIAVGSKGVYLAFVESGFAQAPEIYTVNAKNEPHPLTHLNAGVKPSGRTESIEYENEGFHVQGWLTFPANYDPAKKYPLIVTVHGGPSADAGPGRGGSTWAQHGYFEFQPNPRGSFGQGEKFVQANVKDFGYGDLRDILKGLDVIEAKYPVDKNREGLTGWSYGGFMTMFAVTQTHRFRAAVAGAGISDWQSYYGENSIDQWMIPFFGKSVYDDPAVYAKSSAITFIHQAKTPMLIIVGDRDGECPAPQSFEMWHALREEGVKTQLVIYPNEGHGFRNPEHIRDRNEREVRWFAENMPESK
jgi:dipeptidyl aminopeptidase/acylaminoacyl peptidase